RALLSILLALFSASVTGEEAFHLQLFAQFDVELKQGAGNAHLERARLTVDSAAGNVGVNIKRRSGFAGDQRLFHLDALRFGQEILVQFAAVHLELAAAGTQENPGHARLPASRSVILNLISHLLFSTPSVLAPPKPAWLERASQAFAPDECAYRLCKPSAS